MITLATDFNWNAMSASMISCGFIGAAIAVLVKKDPLKGAAVGVFVGVVLGFFLATAH